MPVWFTQLKTIRFPFLLCTLPTHPVGFVPFAHPNYLSALKPVRTQHRTTLQTPERFGRVIVGHTRKTLRNTLQSLASLPISLFHPIATALVSNRAFAARSRSTHADQNHSNPEPLQDRFDVVRIDIQSIRNRDDDLIVALPRPRL